MQAHWTRKTLVFPPILIGGAVLAYLIATKTPPAHEPPAERLRDVRVIEALATKVIPRAIGYGSVKPGRVWNAVAQVSGKIEYIHPDFKKGAIVQAGTEILRISPQDYLLVIKQATANIRSAEAKLKELRIVQQNTKNSIEIETDALEISKRELSRIQKLLKRGTVAQASMDREERNLLVQRKKLQDLRNSLRLIPAQISSQTEQIDVLRTQAETAKLNLQRTSLRLPFDARIADKTVEITQFVAVGQKLGSADGIKTAEIEAQVPQSRFRALVTGIVGPDSLQGITRDTLRTLTRKLGLHAVIRLGFDDRNAEWRGRIARISDTIDPKTRTIGIIVTVEDTFKKAVAGKRPPLFKGMFVEVEVRANPVKRGIVAPRSALHDESIYVLTNENRLDIRPVKTGLVQGGIVTIVEGVKPGEQIVVGELSPAVTGMLLRPTPDPDLAAYLKRAANGEETLK